MQFDIDESLMKNLSTVLLDLARASIHMLDARSDLYRAEAELRRTETQETKAEHERMRKEIQSLRAKLLPRTGDRRATPADAPKVVMEEVVAVDTTEQPPQFNPIRGAERLTKRG